MLLEQGDDRDVQETIYEPGPSFPQTANAATEPEEEMIVPLQRDDNTAREPSPAISKGPQQPVLRDCQTAKIWKRNIHKRFQGTVVQTISLVELRSR